MSLHYQSHRVDTRVHILPSPIETKLFILKYQFMGQAKYKLSHSLKIREDILHRHKDNIKGLLTSSNGMSLSSIGTLAPVLWDTKTRLTLGHLDTAKSTVAFKSMILPPLTP